MSTKKTNKRKTTVSYDDEILPYLTDPDEAAQYLKVSLEDEDPRIFLLALSRVAKANGGVGMLAKRTGLNRENLYRTLSTKGNPKLSNIDSILKTFGLRLSIEPMSGRARH
jgi:probable addiction module antidote protein